MDTDLGGEAGAAAAVPARPVRACPACTPRGPMRARCMWPLASGHPPLSMHACSACAAGQLLSARPHLTNEMCTPSPLCLPLHSRHMKMPYDTLAHCAGQRGSQSVVQGVELSCCSSAYLRVLGLAVHAHAVVLTRLHFP